MSTEQQFQLNVRIKEEMDDLGKMEPFDDMVLTDKLFTIKEEPQPPPEDEEWLSAFASPQPASPLIIIKGETCPCTGDCPDCLAKRSPPCPECGKTFSRNAQLKIHLRVHTGERPYVCAQCPKAFTQLANLKHHQLTHQAVRSRPFRCTAEGCGKGFQTKTALKIHIRWHTGERPYKCASCAKAFATNGQLTIHLRSHTGERPYQCDSCATAFPTKQQLTVHFRRHTGAKPYKCNRCGKAFTTRSELTVHFRSHTGDKPYRCPLCMKAFTRSSYVKVHQQTVHPRSP